MTMGSWKERVWKQLYGKPFPGSSNHLRRPPVAPPRPPLAPRPELIPWRERAGVLLEEAYAGDPSVVAWLEGRGLTTDDLEEEIRRLSRAIEGFRVPEPTVNIRTMSRKVEGKQRVLSRLVELQSVLDPALRGERRALEKMLGLGYTRVEDLEADVMKLRREFRDPPKN